MYKYHLINNRLIPFIGGSSTSVGSSIAISFDGAVVFNPSASKSTDILFTNIALGEGPVYRINPNGPQDIEIDNKYIDDLIDFSTGKTNPNNFIYKSSTGTLNPKGSSSFNNEIVYPVRFSSAIILKSGLSADPDTVAPPETNVLFFPTSQSFDVEQINIIRFKFNVTQLKSQSSAGTEPANLNLIVLVHPFDEVSDINNYIAGGGYIIDSLVEDGMIVDIDIKIPDEMKSTEGYRISAFKLTEDVAEEGFIAEVEFIGFDEVKEITFNYPRTATVGYAVKSSDFRTGSIPNYSTTVKGLIVDVPSNYNQPVLESGEVDWRQIEVPESGPFSASVNGYRTQDNNKVLKTNTPINIYKGIWDGTYKKDWTENYVWIIKFLITDKDHGLGLPESIIDRYNFYSTAQYCDACDPITGNFVGVTGFADGSFRYKPNGILPEIENVLLGLEEGTPVKERRFVCGISVTDNTSALSLIQSLCAGIRATLTLRGSKLAFVIDKENLKPEQLFNETNIKADSFSISGVREEELINGVEVSYTDYVNHFTKQTLVLTAQSGVLEQDRRLTVEAVGCTRKSQALRLARYLLDTNRSMRRRIQFTTTSQAVDLTVGSIIAVSQRTNNLFYGYGGMISNSSAIGQKTVYLEHLTSPPISNTFFTSNTLPVLLKVFKNNTNTLDYYLLNSNSTIIPSSVGGDLITVNIDKKLSNGVFTANTGFSAQTVPLKDDLWALGVVDPSNIYSSTTGKLFRVDSITVDTEGLVSIAASEYTSDALKTSDVAITDSTFTQNKSLRFTTPPIPLLNLSSMPTRTKEGIISYNVLIGSSTDSSNYSVPITTSVQYGIIPQIFESE